MSQLTQSPVLRHASLPSLLPLRQCQHVSAKLSCLFDLVVRAEQENQCSLMPSFQSQLTCRDICSTSNASEKFRRREKLRREGNFSERCISQTFPKLIADASARGRLKPLFRIMCFLYERRCLLIRYPLRYIKYSSHISHR